MGVGKPWALLESLSLGWTPAPTRKGHMERARCCGCPADVLLHTGHFGQLQWQMWEHRCSKALLSGLGLVPCDGGDMI